MLRKSILYPVVILLICIGVGSTIGKAATNTVQSQNTTGTHMAFLPVVLSPANDIGTDLDWNKDGYADLIVGVPDENLGESDDAGEFNLIFGSGPMFGYNGHQQWHQDSPGVKDKVQDGDRFGFSFTVGDFNGDGHRDLAVGVPDENNGDTEATGAVNIIFGKHDGSRGEFATSENEIWTQSSEGVTGSSERNDFFGYDVAAGDFDGDGYDDLAVGAPLEDIDTVVNAGLVNVLYGTENGLDGKGDQVFDGIELGQTREHRDRLGDTLAVADFNGDGYADLAIGVPYRDIPIAPGNEITDAGAIFIVYGSYAGLNNGGMLHPDPTFWHQDTDGIQQASGHSDLFGAALAAGDFNGDGYGDVAIGVPNETVSSTLATGGVAVLYGSASGITANNDQFLPPTFVEDGQLGLNQLFGATLHSTDLNRDGYTDLVVGAPGEIAGEVECAGSISVIYGSANGLISTDSQTFNQGDANIPDAAETCDHFGAAISSGDYDADGYMDIAVGVPDEDIGAIEDAGAINVLFGSANGITTVGSQVITQNDLDHINGESESGEHFGFSLR